MERGEGDDGVEACLRLPHLEPLVDDLDVREGREVPARNPREPLAELDPNLQPWRGCADVRRDVTVADLLATVADQDVRRIADPGWADLS